MEKENWKAIEAAQIIQLDDADRRLLDHVQGQLDLNDSDFRHFLVLLGKIAPSAARLNAVRLPKSQAAREDATAELRALRSVVIGLLEILIHNIPESADKLEERLNAAGAFNGPAGGKALDLLM